MKKSTRILFVLFFVLGVSFWAFAQPGGGRPPGGGGPCANPPCNPVPITGIEVLLGGGVLLAARFFYKKKREEV